jgi:hypothetical protein
MQPRRSWGSLGSSGGNLKVLDNFFPSQLSFSPIQRLRQGLFDSSGEGVCVEKEEKQVRFPKNSLINLQ